VTVIGVAQAFPDDWGRQATWPSWSFHQTNNLYSNISNGLNL